MSGDFKAVYSFKACRNFRACGPMDAFTPVKFEFNGALRRIRLQTHTISALKQEIQSVEPSLPQFTLTYVDEEGDSVSIITDADLTEALSYFREMNNKTLKVTVQVAAACSAGHELGAFEPPSPAPVVPELKDSLRCDELLCDTIMKPSGREGSPADPGQVSGLQK